MAITCAIISLIISFICIFISTRLTFAGATCPTGDYITPTGCHPCEVGHRCNGTIKSKCPPGTAQAFQGRNKCYDCETGYFQSQSGSIQCERCPSGHFCANKTINATACPPGTSMFATGATKCSTCLKGYYQTKAGQEECLICPSGHACPDSTKEPTPCPMGTNQFFPGATECRGCTRGYFQNNEGQLQCKRCESGYFCPNVTQDQIPCAAGTFGRDTGATDCIDCPNGTYQNESGQQTCISCPVGYFCPSAPELPIPCSPGEYQDQIEQNHCEKCPSGYYQTKFGQADCLPCPMGHYCTDTTHCPIPCPIGTEQPYEGHTSCESCPQREDNSTCPSVRVVDCGNCTVFQFRCDVEKRSVRVNPKKNKASIQQHLITTFGMMTKGDYIGGEEGVFVGLQVSLLDVTVEDLRSRGISEETLVKLVPFIGKNNLTLTYEDDDPSDLELSEKESLQISEMEIHHVSTLALKWGSEMSQAGRNVLGVLLHWVGTPRFWGLEYYPQDTKIVVLAKGSPRNFIWETVKNKAASDEDLLVAIKRTKRYQTKLSENFKILRKQYRYLGGRSSNTIMRKQFL